MALGTKATAAPHLKLDEAIDRLGDTQAAVDSSDAAKFKNLISQAMAAVQAEPVGPEWQGHRQSALALLQEIQKDLANNHALSDESNKVGNVLAEIHASEADADNYVPPAPSATNSLDPSDDSDLRKIRYVEDASAPLYPVGTRFSDGPVMQTNDPDDVLHGKPVYFKTEKNKMVEYVVDSGKPLTKLIYTGRPVHVLTIEIEDEQGHPITGAGPFMNGNVEKTIEVPLPGLKEFKIVITDITNWFVIQNMQFEPAVKAAAPTP